MSWQQLSISGISQLLQTWFWWNFKGKFLGTSRTDSNCPTDIFPGIFCPGDICPCQGYLSCYWPDFDQTLKEGPWEHLAHIATVTVTFVQATFVLSHLSISGVFQLLLTHFWWNLEDKFLGTSRTDSNCHRDTCPGIICPGDICPYQKNLSCYWPNFDKTLKVSSLDYL